MTPLFGHQALEARLKRAFDTHHLHHALLLAGPEGVGKETLAFRLMNYAIAFPTGTVQPDMTSPRDYQETGHPHIFTIRPVFDEKKQRHKRDITLEALDGLVKFLRLAPQSDAPRFILIKPADGMNPQTQNALLKMLEEPPARTHFLLLATHAGGLLPTIRSRCLTIPVVPLDADAFAAGIEAILPHIDAHRIPALYHLSEGALGQAIANEKLALAEHYGRLCAALVIWHDDKNSLPAMQLAEETTRAGQEVLLDKLLTTLFARLAAFVAECATGVAATTIAPEEARLQAIWREEPLPRLLALHETLMQKWQAADDAYLDKKIVMLGILAALSGMDS